MNMLTIFESNNLNCVYQTLLNKIKIENLVLQNQRNINLLKFLVISHFQKLIFQYYRDEDLLFFSFSEVITTDIRIINQRELSKVKKLCTGFLTATDQFDY